MRSDSIFNETHSISVSFANPIKGIVNTEATKKSLSGNKGIEIIFDYRNVAVLSAFTFINVFDTQWALMVEVDEKEAFQAVTNLEELALIKGVAITLAIIIFALFITRVVCVKSKPKHFQQRKTV